MKGKIKLFRIRTLQFKKKGHLSDNSWFTNSEVNANRLKSKSSYNVSSSEFFTVLFFFGIRVRIDPQYPWLVVRRYVQWTMFHRYRRHRWHHYVELCWFKVVLTLFINVDYQYRINIVSTFSTSHHVNIVHILDIVILYDIESTSCEHWPLHRLYLHRSHRCIVVRYRINIVSSSLTCNLLT